MEEKIFVFNEPNINKLKHVLGKLEWSNVLSQNDPEGSYVLFSDKIREAMLECCKIEGPYENR